MNEASRKEISKAFKDLHTDAAKAYRGVYDDIRRQLEGSSSRGLSGEIAQMEARQLNQAILQLTDAVKQAAISKMIDCGCKPYLTQAGWTEIQQSAGLPHTEICKVQVDVMRPSANAAPKASAASASPSGAAKAAAARNRELEELARKLGVAEVGFGIGAAVGAAAVVVSLFIPGWDLPVKVLCVAGAIVAIVSGGAAIYCDSKKNEALSKFEHVGTKEAPRPAPKQEDSVQLDSIVKRITDSQYKRNLDLFDAWLAKVEQALVAECDKLSAM